MNGPANLALARPRSFAVIPRPPLAYSFPYIVVSTRGEQKPRTAGLAIQPPPPLFPLIYTCTHISWTRSFDNKRERGHGMDGPPSDNLPRQKLGNWEFKKKKKGKEKQKWEDACLVSGVYSFVSCLLCLSAPLPVQPARPASAGRQTTTRK